MAAKVKYNSALILKMEKNSKIFPGYTHNIRTG
jgi:hypothetical protein